MVKIKSWDSNDQSAKDIWDYLVSEYQTPGQNLVGGILIGNLPIGYNNQDGEATDLVYWNLATYGDTCTSANVYGGGHPPWQIWVSRMFALQEDFSEEYFGDEPTLLSRAFQANHDFRTGASRFSYMVDDIIDPIFGWTPGPLNIFNNPTENICDGLDRKSVV